MSLHVLKKGRPFCCDSKKNLVSYTVVKIVNIFLNKTYLLLFLYRQPKVRDEAVVCFYIDLYFEVHINVSNCLFYKSTEKILPQFLVYLLFFHFEQNSIVYNHKKVFQLSIVSTKSEFSTWRDNITFSP